VYIPRAARYLPKTTSRSWAGRVSKSSSVPWRRSSAHELIVIAGMNNKSRYGMYRFSSSRFARLLAKKMSCQKATHELMNTKSVMNTYPAGLLK
jgi:hypothetical protein